jgi:hypothetical protein
MTIQLVNADCREYQIHMDRVRMIFADPPDNIGLKYEGFEDRFDGDSYYSLLSSLVTHSKRQCDVLWMSINSRHAPMMGHIIYEGIAHDPDWEVKHCVQTFTFSQHNKHDLGNGHRLLYRFMRKGTQLYPDAVRVPSWRQLNGDPRANPQGKVPNDVFEFPRVTGNSRQRRKFSPTQLNEGLYERCIKLCCAPGDTVVDLCAGSGTLGRVAGRCGVNAIMVEKSRETCDAILLDQPECVEVKI